MLIDLLRDGHKNLYRKRLLRRLPGSAVCAEIGVWAGDFSQLILKMCSPSELHLIDPWHHKPRYEGPRYGKRLEGGQAYLDGLYESVVARFASSSQVQIHRQTSIEAAEAFPAEYFDWIYLDADHSYEMVRADIEAWLPKVKRGGFITGDDYAVSGGWWGDGVVRAVDEAIASGQVDELSVTGVQFQVTKPKPPSGQAFNIDG